MKRNDFTPIESHIRRARLERVVYLSELIADGLLDVFASASRAGGALQDAWSAALRWPDSYSTSITRRTPQV